MSGDGIIFVVSAPSGGGKGTILGRAFARDPKLRPAISATTRDPRSGETEGKEYYFVDEETFSSSIEAARFFEWAEVHGKRYGTLNDELKRVRNEGCDAVLELDVQGMRSAKKKESGVVTVFIVPPSMEVLEARLRGRKNLKEEDLKLRLKNAVDEIACKQDFDYVIVNGELERAVEEFEDIVRQARRERKA